MKKIVKMIMVLFLLCNITGCGDSENENLSNNDNNIVQNDSNQNSSTDVDTDNDSVEKNDMLPRTYAVPGKSIYIDVTKWADKKLSYTWYSHSDFKFVAFVSQKRSDATDLESAHSDAIQWFHKDAVDEVMSNQLNVIKDSYMTINGIDMYQYEGTLRCSTDYLDMENPEKQHEIYAKGYSFIMDGVPCTVIGGVLGDEQAQSDIDEVSEIIDAMIKTLRSEK